MSENLESDKRGKRAEKIKNSEKARVVGAAYEKLKKLIESHMDKLLLKIEEENSAFSTPKNSL